MGVAQGPRRVSRPLYDHIVMTAVKDLSVEELEQVIETAVRRTLEDYLEDHEALGSRHYLESIEKAREEYQAGDTAPLHDLRGG